MRKKLEFQADRIEAVLSLHKVPARVTGGTVTPHWIRFQVLPATGAKISDIRKLDEEMAFALDVPSVKIARRGAAVGIEVPRDDPQPVRLLPLYRQLTGDESSYFSPRQDGFPPTRLSFPPVTAILGLAEDGAPLLVRLPSPDVGHILVAGTEGAGKTVLLQTMVLSLAMANRDLALVLIDPEGQSFSPFDGLPHLARPIVRGIEETIEVLQSLMRLAERRGSLPQDGAQNTDNFPVVVFVDDLELLISDDPEGVGRGLTSLTTQGREVGIYVVAATENASVASIAPGFRVRVAGHMASTGDARTATGCKGTGAERLLGQGDFVVVAEGQVTRFQAAHVSQEEIREAVRDGLGRILPAGTVY